MVGTEAAAVAPALGTRVTLLEPAPARPTPSSATVSLATNRS
ncbi:hypothetical protein [Streptomyces fulvoviolaceus]|nr:hypothetical protein [Streptomyces fulvoviolaceus]MCT9081825.1 hypothetical protein [Streptomyces fulvoviolaceus]